MRRRGWAIRAARMTAVGLAILSGGFLDAAHGASDPGYRVIELPGTAFYQTSFFPSSSKKWELRYQYVVPPLPGAGSWDYKRQTFYLWGDVDFSPYEANADFPLSKYRTNQIVPQLMIGNALAESTTDYSPRWVQFDRWVIEAQYFWYADRSQRFALAGKPLPVSPGDVVTTVIRYDPKTGSIIAEISTPAGGSSIAIPRPFPNEPTLFKSWRDFFERAERKSVRLLGRAAVDVESHYVDQAAYCSILPFEIRAMEGPNFPANGSDDKTRVEGREGLNCPVPFVKLDF